MCKFRQTVHFQFLVLVEEWPIERDVADCECLAKKSNTDGWKGCKQPPPLKIPFQFVVVDTLHMFLRIMGRLFHQVNELLSMCFAVLDVFFLIVMITGSRHPHDLEEWGRS